MILALLLAVQAPAPPQRDVIVTGERLKRLHDQCAAGRCTPLRDAQASIAWAEAQFREGRYVDAKRTLRNAAARNGRHAATDPKPVAAIYEAYATVSWQEGDQQAYRKATAARVRTLRGNLPANDPYVRTAALALGEMWLRVDQPLEAQRAFERAERDAVAHGHGDVAVRARLSRARVRHLLMDQAGARALLRSAEALPGADEPRSRGAIRAMRLRFALTGTGSGADPAERDRLAAELAGAGFTRPVLVWAPPYPRTPLDLADTARSLQRSLATSPGDLFVDTGPEVSDLDGIRWADIGFWIRPDGRTAEAEVLRGSRGSGWAAPYLRQVAGRRYTATAGVAADAPGAYRIERFTLRSNYVVPKGSFIRRRAGAGKLEILDLTDPNARVTAAR